MGRPARYPASPILHPIVIGQQIAADSLAIRLRQLYRDRPDKTLLVRGDGNARYQEIVTAIDVARGAGVRVVGLWTRPK